MLARVPVIRRDGVRAPLASLCRVRMTIVEPHRPNPDDGDGRTGDWLAVAVALRIIPGFRGVGVLPNGQPDRANNRISESAHHAARMM